MKTEKIDESVKILEINFKSNKNNNSTLIPFKNKQEPSNNLSASSSSSSIPALNIENLYAKIKQLETENSLFLEIDQAKSNEIEALKHNESRLLASNAELTNDVNTLKIKLYDTRETLDSKSLEINDLKFKLNETQIINCLINTDQIKSNELLLNRNEELMTKLDDLNERLQNASKLILILDTESSRQQTDPNKLTTLPNSDDG